MKTFHRIDVDPVIGGMRKHTTIRRLWVGWVGLEPKPGFTVKEGEQNPTWRFPESWGTPQIQVMVIVDDHDLVLWNTWWLGNPEFWGSLQMVLSDYSEVVEFLTQVALDL